MKAMAMLTSRKTCSRRTGLSPLEMVIALPFLLGIMTLMVNISHVACWKVRSLTVARQAVWGARVGRTGNTDPPPAYWTANATRGVADAGNVAISQALGSLPNPPLFAENDKLDPSRGLREGKAAASRPFPMLPKMGPFTVHAQDYLLDDKWQYREMGIPWNNHRRTPTLYGNIAALGGQVDALYEEFTLLLNALRTALQPLDNDIEFIYYRWWLTGRPSNAPDFHPRLQNFSSLDRELVKGLVSKLIDRIQGKDVPKERSVAETMTRAFIDLYQQLIDRLNVLMQANPPPSPAQTAAIQRAIDGFQAKIDTLNQFLQTLQ
jgi:hypothetical protein